MNNKIIFLLLSIVIIFNIINICESSCTSSSCLNGGTCTNNNCKCTYQWTGEQCSTKKIQIYSIFPSYEDGSGETILYGWFTSGAPTNILIGTNKNCVTTLVNTDEIRCIAPPGSGSYSLSVSQNGYTWYADNAYNYVIKPY